MRTKRVELNLNESGTLCHLLMSSFVQNGGLSNQPTWALELWAKLAKANDALRKPDTRKQGASHG